MKDLAIKLFYILNILCFVTTLVFVVMCFCVGGVTLNQWYGSWVTLVGGGSLLLSILIFFLGIDL
jgi:hypothetical protein